MKELKSCPWCPTSEVVIVYAPGSEFFSGQCNKCLSQGPIAKTEAEAIAAWNRRSNDGWVKVGDGNPYFLIRSINGNFRERHESIEDALAVWKHGSGWLGFSPDKFRLIKITTVTATTEEDVTPK